MARLGVTYEEIAEIADHLLRAQVNPTIEAAHYVLRGTGNFSTISKYLKACVRRIDIHKTQIILLK